MRVLLWNMTKNESPFVQKLFLSCTKPSQLCCTASAHVFGELKSILSVMLSHLLLPLINLMLALEYWNTGMLCSGMCRARSSCTSQAALLVGGSWWNTETVRGLVKLSKKKEMWFIYSLKKSSPRKQPNPFLLACVIMSLLYEFVLKQFFSSPISRWYSLYRVRRPGFSICL